MKLQLTLAAIERFEDASGQGLIALVDGSDQQAIKARWTVRRLRLLAQSAAPFGTTVEDIDEWLKPPQLVEAQMSAIVQVVEQLSPPLETDDAFGPAKEGGESTGNLVSGAG